jgi:hypothetical protein
VDTLPRILTGEKVFYNEALAYIRDSGGFGVTKSLPATELARNCTVSARSPDVTVK